MLMDREQKWTVVIDLEDLKWKKLRGDEGICETGETLAAERGTRGRLESKCKKGEVFRSKLQNNIRGQFGES